MRIPLTDLKAQYNSLKDEIDAAIRNVIDGTQFILGPEVTSFEAEMAAYCQTRFAVGVASGTDALQLALLACGVKPGDEVITTPFTFIATTETIIQCGAVPVFVDIDPRTYNTDTQKLKELLEKKFSQSQSESKSRVTAIIPVHLYGHPVDMDPILEMAKKYNLSVIEDCAQALGAGYKGRKVGSFGDAGCLSFFPSKVLGAYGDGGMVVTNSQEIADKLRMLRNHGGREKYYHLISGFNSRLDELQAAILRVKLRHLDGWIDQRRQKAMLYSQFFDRIDEVGLPYVSPGSYHIFNYYTIRLKSSKFYRDNLQKHLSDQGIATAIYYPLSLHLQDVYRNLGYRIGDLPESEQAQDEVLSLPMYPELSDDHIARIARTISDFCKTQARVQ